MTDVARYRSLFVHRDDVYARQHDDGHYEPVREPLTDDDIAEHLAGFVSYGVYVIRPLDPETFGNGVVSGNDGRIDPPQSVKYALFDLDTYDAGALDFLCRAVERWVSGSVHLTEVSDKSFMRALLLEDSGGKGYHLWLILSEPVSAAKVRAWCEPIRAQYQAGARTAVGEPWPALEIFPKQDEVPAGGYGNLVKLPLGRHAKSGATSFWLERAGWAHGIEDVAPFDVALIPEPPARPARRVASDDDGERVAPFACISKILTEGASHADHNRDFALYHFCRYAVSCGLPADMVADWAEQVNELFDPPLTATEVRTKVRSALRATTANPGCSAEWLRDYCPGGGSCFAPWNDRGDVRRGARDKSEDEAWLSPEARRAQRQEGD